MKTLLITALALASHTSLVLAQDEETEAAAEEVATNQEEAAVNNAESDAEVTEVTDAETEAEVSEGSNNTDTEKPKSENTRDKCVSDNTKIADAALAPFADKINAGEKATEEA